MVHEVQLIDYSVVCESSSHGKGTLVLDVAEADPINTLHVTSSELWQDLTITVAFSFKNLYEQVLMDHNGNVTIPPWVFKHATTPLCLGEVIFTGSAPNLRRIIVSLPYVVTGDSGAVDPSKLYARWPIYSAPTKEDFPETGYDNVIYKAENERVLYQWNDETGTYEQLVFAPSFVDTNTTYKLEIDPDNAHKIILYAKDIDEEDWRNVGEIETADTVYNDQALRDAIQGVSKLVGDTSVAEQISTAVHALSVSDEAVAGQFVTTVTQSDGKVTVARRALQESDVPTLSMGKISGLQGALDLKATAQSVTAVDNKVTQLSGTVNTVQGSVNTLIGNDANKSVRTIANEELAAQLIPEGATEALDTLQEIAAWIQQHPDDAAALNSSITALQAQLNGIEAGNGTVKTYVDTAVQDLAQQVNQDIQEIELTPGPQGPQGESGEQGPVGLTGATPNITMQVTGLGYDQEPTVSKSGTPEEPVFTVGIPQGQPGKDGVQIDDAAVSSAETWSSRKIIDTLCPEFSVSGNPVTCTPVEGYPLGAVVTLEPKQAGTGDPSPDNVRPITGRDRVKVTVSNERESHDYDLTLPETIYGGTVDAVSGDGSNETIMFELAIADMNNDENYPGWKAVTNLTDVVGAGYNRTLNNGRFIACNITKSALTADGSGCFGVNTLNQNSILFLTKDTFGLTQTQWKEQYPDLVFQICLKLANPEPFQVTGNHPIPALAGENTVHTDGNSLSVSGRSDPLSTIQTMQAQITALQDQATQGGAP